MFVVSVRGEDRSSENFLVLIKSTHSRDHLLQVLKKNLIVIFHFADGLNKTEFTIFHVF